MRCTTQLQPFHIEIIFTCFFFLSFECLSKNLSLSNDKRNSFQMTTNDSRAPRTAQAGLHENPDFILQYLQEIELLAEQVLAERRDVIELNKRRDKLREASR